MRSVEKLEDWPCTPRPALAADLARLDDDILLACLDGQLPGTNAAFFDVASGFRDCVPGIHEILRSQGLLDGVWSLDPHELLAGGQAEETDRVLTAHPRLTDDAFVAGNRDRWFGG